ncbi:MAG: gamma-glutamyltransferase, partial [Rhodospirillales bacterium]|nr:gamma-glutamyltransferase [Rhodospirillales bacterium]
PVGVLRTGVPSAPDAWITALREYGTMSFGDVAAAAIEYARDGFSVFHYLASALKHNAEAESHWPANAAIFMPGGRVPQLGERFVQTDLAATIQYMADEEKAAAHGGRKVGLEAARAAFYVGDIAEAIVTYMQSEGGYLSRDDLANFRSPITPPIQARWRDFEINTCGPWCQGPALIQSLLTMERAGLDGLQQNSADYLHLLIEVIKCTFADREYYYGDPDFVNVPLDRLHGDDNIDAWLKRIDPEQAITTIPMPNGVNEPFDFPATEGLPERDPDTSYLCAVDKWGNAFSATPSDGMWMSPVIPGTGLILSARGCQSRTDPNHPSGVAPGKRPRLTPNPALAVRDDGTVVPFGAPGGDAQVQSMLQVFLNVFHFGMDVQDAIDAPRITSHNFPSSFYPYNYYPGCVSLENRIDETVRKDLEDRGHRIDLYPDYTRNAAAVEMIVAEPKPGFIRAGADPRQPAYAIVR